MRVGFDTNLFIYSFDRNDPTKHTRAVALIGALLDENTVVPMQIISETLNAAHYKRHLSAADARLACEDLADLLRVEPATPQDALAASRLAEEHKIQFFDAQMVVVHARLGATILLSEDLQDGRRFGALRIVSPFNAANDGLLALLLRPAP